MKVILILLLVFLAIAFIYSPHLTRDEYVGIVSSKERVIKGRSSYYLVFIDLDDGDNIVLKNSDSWVEWKFNSSNLYGKIKIGHKYKFHTYGWRISFLSWYKNIINVKEV